MSTSQVLLLGDPRLYEKCTPVVGRDWLDVPNMIARLDTVLNAFKTQYGAFRGIAAPQLGIMKRMIYMNIDHPVVIINPELSKLSEEMFELWDDCMCFPNLLVRVKRHYSCTLRFQNEHQEIKTWQVEGGLSELIQHEYDHLEGILAIQRAIAPTAFMWRP
ncbi:MAG TPA: peptide deformylase [Rhodothermales bacterium]|nr:peptide deformylase [Rhodothermales bacterium]HRR07417.1 peptide deformylase [Rhodothermales bacterium]